MIFRFNRIAAGDGSAASSIETMKQTASAGPDPVIPSPPLETAGELTDRETDGRTDREESCSHTESVACRRGRAAALDAIRMRICRHQVWHRMKKRGTRITDGGAQFFFLSFFYFFFFF